MNLVRLGHYFTPSGDSDIDGLPHGSCRTALIVAISTPDDLVNLAVWEADGDQQKRLAVPVAPPSEASASFHLSGECPWKR